MSKESPILVTFAFDDDEQFHHFLEKNDIDTYTYNWKKREYFVNLASDVKVSMESTIKSPDKSAPEPDLGPTTQMAETPGTSVSSFL